LDIKQTLFKNSTIQECDFISTNLTGCNFSGSNLRASRFQNTNLERADVTRARDYFIDPTTNKLKGARFSYPDVLGLLEGFGIKVE
jgi:uncharacterized protein YjbI with pentapeptide repeats